MRGQAMQDNTSLEVGKLLSNTYAYCIQLSSQEAINTLEAAEKKCLNIDTSSLHALEIKRRVAELKLQILCDHRARFSLVENSRQNLIEVGFTNLEREITNEIYFVIYCEKIEKTNTAKEVLGKLIEKIQIKLNSIDDKSGAEYSFYLDSLNNSNSRLKKY